MGLVWQCDSGVARCQSQQQVSLLANALDVRSAFHGLVSLAAAVNHMCVIHEAMNGCENLKIHLRLTLKM